MKPSRTMKDGVKAPLTTRDLARVAGISEQAVRDYESAGLLPPVPRAVNGYRAFSASHLAALLVVRGLKDAGYARDEMKRVMGAIDRGSLAPAMAILDAHHHTLWERRTELARGGGDAGAAPLGARSRRDLHSCLTIGAAARRVGVSVATVRFWEAVGVVQVGRDPANGYRRFTEANVDRLAAVKALRGLGVSWDAIREAVRDAPPAREDAPRPMPAIQVDIDRQSLLNARATSLVWAYASVRAGAAGEIGHDPLRAFLDILAAMPDEPS